MKTLKWLKKLFTGQLVFIDSEKLLFYKELESENKIINKDIYTLIRKPDTFDCLAVHVKYDMQYELGDAMWNSTQIGIEHFKGFCEIFKKDSDE